MKKILFLCVLFMTESMINISQAKPASTVRVATFNVSMEALNYAPSTAQTQVTLSGSELLDALKAGHQQIKNIAEIIQTINPDIILLNEFDNGKHGEQALQLFLNDFLNVSQNNQPPIHFPYAFQGTVNTGVNSNEDLNGNGVKGELPSDGYGFGYFPGHFGMVLLSKHPIDTQKIRTFQHFKWKDMPDHLKPVSSTGESWYSEKAWQNFPLSSKSHWDIPVIVGNVTIQILASHPTPPVFDGDEDRNGRRNHDEIRFWHDYINPTMSSYIYDDNEITGGLASDNPFIILGDLNASDVEGDAIHHGISSLLTDEKIQDAKPKSEGALINSPDNIYAGNHTAYWKMRADYVLASKHLLTINDSGVFWPKPEDSTFQLIKDRQSSSDHRLVWVDLTIKN